MRLCKYLNFSIVIVPVNGSDENPLEKNSEITKNRKKIRNATELEINALTDLLIKASSSRVFTMYNNPLILERNNTAKPRARFRTFSKASRPYQRVAQWTWFIWLRVNIAPVKKVATATPIRNGPREPFKKRKRSNVFRPRTL